MQSDLEQRIQGERASITALDSALDSNRAPYLKSQLRSAGHLLDDAEAAMRLAGKAAPKYVAMWMGFAEISIQMATDKRRTVEVAVDAYGGAEHVIEIGG
jgi:hypothetical protein